MTGTYGSKNQRQGVRYMTNGLKVYYCPQMSIHDQASLPTLYGFFPLFRQVRALSALRFASGWRPAFSPSSIA